MEPTSDKTLLLSLEAASRELGGLSVWTLRRHLEQGTIRPTRIGRRVFLSRAEVNRIANDGLPSVRNEVRATNGEDSHEQ